MADATASFGTVGLVATSTVLAAILTAVVTWVREGLATNKAGNFAALYLSMALETYAADCSSMLWDVHNHDDSHGEHGAPHRNIPKMAPYPEEINWEALGLQYAQPAMQFQIDVENDRANLSGLWDFDDEQAIHDARVCAADRGLEALELAGNFRRSRGLKPRKVADDGWSVDANLASRQAEYRKMQKENDERAAERAKAKAAEQAAPIVS